MKWVDKHIKGILLLFIFIFNIQSIFWGLRSVSGWFQVSLRSHILICRTVDTQFHNPAPVLRNPRCQHQPFNRPPSARPRNTCCPTKQASQSVNLLSPSGSRQKSELKKPTFSYISIIRFNRNKENLLPSSENPSGFVNNQDEVF